LCPRLDQTAGQLLGSLEDAEQNPFLQIATENSDGEAKRDSAGFKDMPGTVSDASISDHYKVISNPF